MPATTDLFFGRDLEIEAIVQALIKEPASSASKRVRFALLGAGGMGKTATALKLMRHPAILHCYPVENSVWVPCGEATSAALLLDVIHSALGIDRDTHNTIHDILAELRDCSGPLLLLLDNFETPWNAPGARAAVAHILLDIAQFPHVALFITMRAAAPPCEEITWEEKRLLPLAPDSSYHLYTSIDTKSRNDCKVSELLEILGHMPLAVKLMGRHGKNTGCTIEQLISSYSSAMLGPSRGSDPQNSVPISISMSLNSSLVSDELNAKMLLDIIAFLPAGTTFENLQRWWASDLKNLDGALRSLLEASLLERQETNYFVLPVIRSYILESSRLSDDIHRSIVKAACSFLKHHDDTMPGSPVFKEHMVARTIEEINFQSILLETTESSSDVLGALLILAWHQYQTRPRTEVIEHAVMLANKGGDPKLIGDVFHCHAAILENLNRFDKALEQYTLARKTYITASAPRLAAGMLLEIADVSTSIDPQTNEIPLIEKALRELQAIDGPQRILRPFVRLLNQFTKTRPKPSLTVQEDMVICLQRLGRAYSRSHQYLQAIKPLTQARDLSGGASFDGAECAQALAQAYHRLQQYDQAEKWAKVALDEWKQMGGYVGYCLRLLGMIYISQGKYDLAIESLEEGLEKAKTRGDPQHLANIWLELGRAHLKKGTRDQAQTALVEALKNYEGAAERMIICKFYLEKLENSARNPTAKEVDALVATWHKEDVESR
ncbi:hypothetical protein C8J56DRAFT_395099 [Mycena floridula]|nr:hypothetical protein C8J56DRAFT_395099 [Mycena floridula]